MICCSRQCAPLAILIIGSITAILGLTLILLYHIFITMYITIGSNHSQSNDLWNETPSALHFSVYLYNGTNPEDVTKSKREISPELKECDRYVFLEHHLQVNMTWNINDTVILNIGFPVESKPQFQVNYYIEPELYISTFEHIEPTFQSRLSASEPKSYTFVINILISLSNLAIYIGWSLFGFGLILILLGIYVFLTRNRESNEDTEQLLLDQDDIA